jgi:DNA-binding CsgD family transcriptional regulator
MRERVLDREAAVGLTEMELAVAGHLLDGLSRDATARRMNLSPSSVARLLQRIYAKTETDNTLTAMVVLALRGELTVNEELSIPPSIETGPVARAIFVKMVSCLDWRELANLRAAYNTCMKAGL